MKTEELIEKLKKFKKAEVLIISTSFGQLDIEWIEKDASDNKDENTVLICLS